VHYQYPTFTHIYTIRRGVYHYSNPDRSHGIEFHGTRGVLTLDRDGWVVTPGNETLTAERQPHVGAALRPRAELPPLRPQPHGPAGVEIEDMHRATTTCHLANIAFRVGHRVYWTPNASAGYRGYNAGERRFIQEDAAANAFW